MTGRCVHGDQHCSGGGGSATAAAVAEAEEASGQPEEGDGAANVFLVRGDLCTWSKVFRARAGSLGCGTASDVPREQAVKAVGRVGIDSAGVNQDLQR